MTCEELLSALSRYIDHELEEELVAEAQAHLAQCHNCTRVLNTTQGTIELSRGLQRVKIPAESRTQLFMSLQRFFQQSSPSASEDRSQGAASEGD
jgi:Putative zinc-finger